MRSPSKRKNEEAKTQAKILKWLSRSGLVHWRQNSGVAWMGPRKINLGPAGLPDIVVVIPPTGRFVGLEVKSSTGTLRPAQREFAEQLSNTGGVYRVVRSLQDAVRTLFDTLPSLSYTEACARVACAEEVERVERNAQARARRSAKKAKAKS